MRRLAVLSLHTSPLAQPGTGDGGGMNVYVRELTSALARSDVACDVFTRAWSPDLPAVVDVEPGCGCTMSPPDRSSVLPKESLPAVVDEFTAAVLERMAAAPAVRRAALHLGARQLLAVGALGPRHQARAEPAAGVHVPHARSRQGRVDARGGRGRHAPPPGRGRGVHHRLLRRRPGFLHRRGRPDRLALRRRARAHPHRAARRRPCLLRSRPPAASPPRPRSAGRWAAPPLRRPDPAAQVCRRGHRDAGRAARGR